MGRIRDRRSYFLKRRRDKEAKAPQTFGFTADSTLFSADNHFATTDETMRVE